MTHPFKGYTNNINFIYNSMLYYVEVSLSSLIYNYFVFCGSLKWKHQLYCTYGFILYGIFHNLQLFWLILDQGKAM
jgi:hypothetical protein